MNRNILATLCAALSVVNVSSYAAELNNPSWYVVPQVGAMVPDQTTLGAFVGVKLGKQMSDNIDVQVGLSHGSTNDKQAGYLSSEYQQDALTVEGVYLLSRGTLQPFVSAGLGIAKDDFSAVGDSNFGMLAGIPNIMPNRDESGTSLVGSLGAGLRYAVNPNVFLQTDARYLLSNSDTDKSILYLALGAGFYLGAQPVAPVVRAPVEPTPEPVIISEPIPVVVAPVVQPMPEPVIKKPAPVVVKTTLRNLNADNLFSKGSSALTPKATKEIDSALLASGIDIKKASSITVVGHADRTGSALGNQKLSERRAEAVKAFLVKKGVAANSIKTEGRGSSEPVTTLSQCPARLGAKLSSCLAPDRRITITVE
ncbi:MAG: OmpA family protein [Moraxellaceae bacterium]|jgi:OOP family OmpA-OmpF porin|nr:OmpA family protein [Moraxellaceae bacterium]MBK8326048.1 OmpA family protein [Moraxellaceae bacterium]